MQNDNSAELNRVNAEPTQKAVEDEIKALKAQLAAAHGLKQLDLEPEFRQWTKVRRRPARRYLKK